MSDPKLLREEADKLEQKADQLRQKAGEIEDAIEDATPVAERLVYAAYTRCKCGYGMAYDPASPEVRQMRGAWYCSALLLEICKDQSKHTPGYPFAFYEIKGEDQPSVNGATTRTPMPPAQTV